LADPTDKLDAERIFAEGGGREVIGCEGEVLEAVESTMDAARRKADSGAPDGYVVLAEKQRSGRGRTGSWQCGAREGLLMSVVLRLEIPPQDRKATGLMGAVAATEAVRAFGVEAHIKWPNDVVVALRNGDSLRIKKLGGVIVEQSPQGDAHPAHVLGIGLNVNQDTRRLSKDVHAAPTSLKIESGGRPVDRNALCIELLGRLDEWYAKLRSDYVEALLARWRSLSCLLGEQVRADVAGKIVAGKVLGLRATGELIFLTDDGEEMLLASEKASLLL